MSKFQDYRTILGLLCCILISDVSATVAHNQQNENNVRPHLYLTEVSVSSIPFYSNSDESSFEGSFDEISNSIDNDEENRSYSEETETVSTNENLKHKQLAMRQTQSIPVVEADFFGIFNPFKHKSEQSKKDEASLWKWCKNEPEKLQKSEVHFDPIPIVSGKNFVVKISGELLEPMEDMSIVTHITIPPFIHFIDKKDFCKHKPGLCPLQPGFNEIELTYFIPMYISGKMKAVASVLSGHHAIACVNLGPIDIVPM